MFAGLINLFYFVQTIQALSSTISSMSVKSAVSQPVRIVSYNVLSSHLASPSHFTACDPKHLDANNRLSKVLSKLENEMDASHSTIFCLQEVSHDWAGHLHTFFANRQYHLITGLYGKKFNGYMGVALAYPTSFETISVDLCRLSDKRTDGWPRPPVAESVEDESWRKILRDRVSRWIQRAALKFSRRGAKETNSEVTDPWNHSEDRQNMLITLGLRFKDKDSKIFWVSNYHMPCAYYAPMVMNMHIEMAAKRVQTLAGSDPYVLAGDWNVVPSSPQYQLAIHASLPKEDPSYPTSKFGVDWKPTTLPMRSAYKVYNGKEPDFTNYAKVKDGEPFIETLDYIFLSHHWLVIKVKDLPNRDDILDGPFPNADQPSDHLLIAADLHLKLE